MTALSSEAVADRHPRALPNSRTGASIEAAAPVLLEVRSITKRWPKREHPVLDAVDLSLQEGSVVHIGGRNGSGKTTLLRIATGLILPDQGTVSLYGMDPVRDRAPFQRRIACLSAGDRGLYARLSVRRHLDYWARLAFIPRRERGEVIATAIERFGLGNIVGSRVDRISMGQRQRVRLAMTFMHSPDVVLLDEPGNSLDVDGVQVLATLVAQLRDSGGAAIWCSPAAEFEPFSFDHTYILSGGRLGC